MEEVKNKLKEISDKMDEVYAKGQVDKRKIWWSAITQNGTRTNYEYAFYAMNLNSICGFNPPITLKPLKANAMFQDATGLDVITASQLDLSLATNGSNLFQMCDVKLVEKVDLSNVSGTIYNVFHGANSLETIGELVLKADGSQSYSDNFIANAPNLKNIIITGVIGNNFRVNYCTKVSKQSIESIIGALSNTATGKVLNLSKVAVNNAFESATGATDGSSTQEWLDLIATKPNWTITLVT